MESTQKISALKFSDLAKRARNAASKRVGLLEALVARLDARPLAAIPVRELCDEVGVTEQTFFNTFRGKPGALVFFVMLWSVEMQWRMRREVSAHDALEALFDSSAAQMRRARWLMPEIIVHQIRAAAGELELELESALPTLADKLLRFPELAGIEAFEPLPIHQLFGQQIERAVAGGELPPNTDTLLATRLCCALFFGAAASLADPDAVAELLHRSFETLWQGFATKEDSP